MKIKGITVQNATYLFKIMHFRKAHKVEFDFEKESKSCTAVKMFIMRADIT
jgi:hypothetical protein